MKVGFSPEVTLLLMACTVPLSAETKGRITEFLRQQPINWQRVYTLAIRHRLTPFAYRSLFQIPGVPAAFIDTLQNDCRTTATDNLIKLHHYHQLKSLLEANEIPHIAMKGVHLAEHGYPDSSLRISGDIDVLIRPDDVFRTVHLLQANDYILNQQQGFQWQQGEQRILNDLYEVSLFKPFFNDSHFDIDLHWKVLFFNRNYAYFDLDYVHSQSTHTTERELILLVTHHGVMNVWQQLYYINDLYFSLYQREIDWPWLLQETKRVGLDRVFLAGLYWCVQIWALPLPPAVHTACTSPEISDLADSYAAQWEAEKPAELSKLILAQLTFFLKAQAKVSRQLTIFGTFLSSRIFRYSMFKIGNRMLYVPKELGFLTLFIRATQSLVRFLPRRD